MLSNTDKIILNSACKTIPALNRPGYPTDSAGILLGDIINNAISHPQPALDSLTKRLLNDWSKYTPELHLNNEVVDEEAISAAIASGSLTAIAWGAAAVQDADSFVLDDGVHAAITFEFDTNGSVVPSAILRPVNITAGVAPVGRLTAIAWGAAAIQDADTFVLDDGVHAAITFEFDTDGSVVPSPTLRPVTIVAGVAPVGSLTAIAEGVAGVQDGDTFILDDGVHAAITFEFDTDGSVVPSPTLQPVTILVGATDADVKAAIILAITGATIDITATAGAGMLIDLANTNLGIAGNIAITETIASLATLTPVGMAGGVDGSTDAQVKAAIILAITGATIDIAAVSGPGMDINLTNANLGTAGNVAITETIASLATLTPIGMAGGVDGSTDAQVKAAILASIAAATIDITAASGAGMLISLVNDRAGARGNVAITESIASLASLTPVGMVGGANASSNHIKLGDIIDAALTESGYTMSAAVQAKLNALGKSQPAFCRFGDDTESYVIQLGDILAATLIP